MTCKVSGYGNFEDFQHAATLSGLAATDLQWKRQGYVSGHLLPANRVHFIA